MKKNNIEKTKVATAINPMINGTINIIIAPESNSTSLYFSKNEAIDFVDVVIILNPEEVSVFVEFSAFFSRNSCIVKSYFKSLQNS